MEKLATDYESKSFKVGKTEYSVLIVTGERNYISVKKETANPFGCLGTQFKNFDEARAHYKNENIKLALLQIETGIL